MSPVLTNVDPCPVTLRLDEDRREFQPGEILSGEYLFEGINTLDTKRIELSMLWFTEGKGEEDLGVHFFDQFDPHQEPGVDLRRPRRFSARLPHSPLSYHGAIVRVRWVVRLRVLLFRGRDVVVDVPFRLGAVPPSTELTP